MLDLHCCKRAFSGCGEQELLSSCSPWVCLMVQMMEIDAQVGEEGGPNDKAQRKQYLMMSFKVMEILV